MRVSHAPSADRRLIASTVPFKEPLAGLPCGHVAFATPFRKTTRRVSVTALFWILRGGRSLGIPARDE